MKYRIMSNNYPYSTLIADGFNTYSEAKHYAEELSKIWYYGRFMWHIEEYRP